MTEKEYLIFCLGFDILQNSLLDLECDKAFELCTYIVEDFYKSEESKLKCSAYEALKQYINNNYNIICRKYTQFKGGLA